MGLGRTIQIGRTIVGAAPLVLDAIDRMRDPDQAATFLHECMRERPSRLSLTKISLSTWGHLVRAFQGIVVDLGVEGDLHG